MIHRPSTASKEAVADGRPPSVAILLGTCQGERFLAPQLDSIAAQTHARWHVWASDDNSTDGTLGILEDYRRRWGDDRLSIRRGPGKGFCANFLSLACDPSIQADFYAFADHDDVWDDDKLAVALAWLSGMPHNVPALYCARTRLIDEDGRPMGFSPLFARPLSFRNALVQSVAGGNTMVFNQAARDLLAEAGVVDVQTHDWWLYLIVTACGGRTFYDPVPKIGYRQHPNNLVGSNADWPARLSRAKRLLAGRFTGMNDRNIVALKRLQHHMSAENKSILTHFVHARKASLAPRVRGIRHSGVYHHTRLGNLGLVVATLFKKL